MLLILRLLLILLLLLLLVLLEPPLRRLAGEYGRVAVAGIADHHDVPGAEYVHRLLVVVIRAGHVADGLGLAEVAVGRREEGLGMRERRLGGRSRRGGGGGCGDMRQVPGTAADARLGLGRGGRRQGEPTGARVGGHDGRRDRGRGGGRAGALGTRALGRGARAAAGRV